MAVDKEIASLDALGSFAATDLMVTLDGFSVGDTVKKMTGTVLTTYLDSLYQPLDAGLTDIAALAVTDSNFIVGDGANWVVETGATARTSLGLGTIATQAANSVTITGGSITGITDLAIADGGTASSTASAARTALGLAIGSDVQAYDAFLTSIGTLGTAADKMIYTTGIDTAAETSLTSFARTILDDADQATTQTTLGLGTTDTPEFDGLTIGSAAGIDANPGSDIDTDLVTVGVTGTPILKWDESEDAFSQNKGLRVTSGTLGIATASPDAIAEILGTSTQLRLTHTDASKFVDFTLDTNHDLTITPSSTGQVIFQPTTDSADFFQVLDADGGTPVFNVDSTNERVSISTPTPGSSKVHVTNNTTSLLQLDNIGASSSSAGAGIIALHNDGAALASGDRLGFQLFSGYDGATVRNSAGISVYADDTWTSGDSPSRLEFQVTIAGSASRGTAMTIKNDRRVGIKTGSPAAQLHVDQSSTTAAFPVLYLDQADVDQDMIKFVTTIGTGNAIEAVGGKTLTTTHFIKVGIPGSLTRYIPIGTIA